MAEVLTNATSNSGGLKRSIHYVESPQVATAKTASQRSMHKQARVSQDPIDQLAKSLSQAYRPPSIETSTIFAPVRHMPINFFKERIKATGIESQSIQRVAFVGHGLLWLLVDTGAVNRVTDVLNRASCPPISATVITDAACLAHVDPDPTEAARLVGKATIKAYTEATACPNHHKANAMGKAIAPMIEAVAKISNDPDFRSRFERLLVNIQQRKERSSADSLLLKSCRHLVPELAELKPSAKDKAAANQLNNRP